MIKTKNIIVQIRQQGLIVLFYHDDVKVCYEVVRALYKGGIRIIEFTNRGKNALANFKYLLKKRDEEWGDLLLAIGTIKIVKEAEIYIKAGADFIISPGVIKEVGEAVQEADLLWMPGCMTTTEIMLAEECGAGLVKLFPGNLLGPGFMRAIRELFPGMYFMPTGGVEAEHENLKAWFDAGVCAVGMGSQLVSKHLLVNKQYNKITQLAIRTRCIINKVRGDKG